MSLINIEIKAKSNNQDLVRVTHKSNNADFKGTDHQIDTYFKVSNGRLKLRKGNIENQLIFYDRENKQDPKKSDIALFKTESNISLKEVLIKSLGVLVVVDKQREIYFIDNVKFHIDTVKDLGTFVEIEAIGENEKADKDELLRQCKYYMKLFKISAEDLISVSYSDLLLQKGDS